MLAELVDGVIGIDTHRDTHHAEIAYPTGAAIATCSIGSDSAGYAHLLAWCREHAPGPRLVICIEGTAATAPGWPAPPRRPGCRSSNRVAGVTPRRCSASCSQRRDGGERSVLWNLGSASRLSGRPLPGTPQVTR
jgi:hypothetical protein